MVRVNVDVDQSLESTSLRTQLHHWEVSPSSPVQLASGAGNPWALNTAQLVRGAPSLPPLRIRASDHSQLSRSQWAPRSSRSGCLEGTASRSPGFRSPAGPGPPRVLDNRQGTSEGRPDEGWPTTGVSPDPHSGPSALEGSEEPGCGAGGVCPQGPARGRPDGSTAGRGLTRGWAGLEWGPRGPECGRNHASFQPRSREPP